MSKPKIHPNVWAAYVTAGATVVAAAVAFIPKNSPDRAEPSKPQALVDQRDPNNWTPLYRAARDNNESAVERLLDQGADPAAADNHGITPIFLAATRGNAKMVRILIGKGAAIDVANDLKQTPLHMAAQGGDIDTIKALAVDRNGNPTMNVNAEDIHGQRPLHYASKAGKVEAVKLLLDLGAEDSKDDEGHSAYELAASNQVRDAIKDAQPKLGHGNRFKIKL
jgi:ankyrin repeat protein